MESIEGLKILKIRYTHKQKARFIFECKLLQGDSFSKSCSFIKMIMQLHQARFRIFEFQTSSKRRSIATVLMKCKYLKPNNKTKLQRLLKRTEDPHSGKAEPLLKSSTQPFHSSGINNVELLL